MNMMMGAAGIQRLGTRTASRAFVPGIERSITTRLSIGLSSATNTDFVMELYGDASRKRRQSYVYDIFWPELQYFSDGIWRGVRAK